MKLIRWTAVCSVAALLATGAAYPQAVKVDEAIGTYQTTGGVSGNLNSIGSDTLNNLMTLWAEGFQNAYPNLKIQIEGKGSSTAPPALIMGTAQIGPMSRAMKSARRMNSRRRSATSRPRSGSPWMPSQSRQLGPGRSRR
jgi:phosphate transport system substrate-binding protein